MTESVLLNEVREHVATLTINRPERRNALNLPLMVALQESLDALEADPDVRIIVLRGAGDKAFCAGADLQGTFSESTPRETNDRYARILQTLLSMSKPTVACVNGDCLGGGFGIALACDIILAKDTARLGTPEVKVGLFPMMISPLILRNLPEKLAYSIMLQGTMLTADKLVAQAPALATVVTGDALDSALEGVLKTLLRAAPLAQQHGKRALRAIANLPTEEAIGQMAGRLHDLMQTEDAAEALIAFMEKRKPTWNGR